MYKPTSDERRGGYSRTTAVDLAEVMDLPHMEEIKKELKSKILKRITFLPNVISSNGVTSTTRNKNPHTATALNSTKQRQKLPWKQLYERSDQIAKYGRRKGNRNLNGNHTDDDEEDSLS